MHNREIKVVFDAKLTVVQNLEVDSDCPLTKDDIIKGLNGENEKCIFTTLGDEKEVLWIKHGEILKIGKVLKTQIIDAEYSEFMEA